MLFFPWRSGLPLDVGPSARLGVHFSDTGAAPIQGRKCADMFLVDKLVQIWAQSLQIREYKVHQLCPILVVLSS
jgi:hypothetical protein